MLFAIWLDRTLKSIYTANMCQRVHNKPNFFSDAYFFRLPGLYVLLQIEIKEWMLPEKRDMK